MFECLFLVGRTVHEGLDLVLLRSFDLLRGGVSLAMDFEFSKSHPRPTVSFSVCNQDLKLSTIVPEPHLSASCHNDHGLIL